MTLTLEPLGPFALAEPVRMAFMDDSGVAAAFAARFEGGAVAVDWVSELQAEAVERHVARILSLDVDARGVGEVEDPVARNLLASGRRPVCFGSPFEAAVWAVLTQRQSMAQAGRIKDALAVSHGVALEIDGARLHAFPAPEVLAELDSLQGLSATKLERIRALATAATAGDLDPVRLRARDLDVALEHLQTLPGIGPFGATLVLARGAGHPDVPPPTLRRFRQAVGAPYGRDGEMTDAEIASLSEGWRPYRAWVTFLMRSGAGA